MFCTSGVADSAGLKGQRIYFPAGFASLNDVLCLRSDSIAIGGALKIHTSARAVCLRASEFTCRRLVDGLYACELVLRMNEEKTSLLTTFPPVAVSPSQKTVGAASRSRSAPKGGRLLLRRLRREPLPILLESGYGLCCEPTTALRSLETAGSHTSQR